MTESEEEKCQTCSSKLVRSHTTDEYLFWKCTGCDAPHELEHFSDMSDESWEWVKQYMREGK